MDLRVEGSEVDEAAGRTIDGKFVLIAGVLLVLGSISVEHADSTYKFDEHRTYSVRGEEIAVETELSRTSELVPVAGLQQVLAALADPVRLEMVRRMAEAKDATVACAMLYDGIGKSTASHHFKTLREAGVIQRIVEDGQTHQRLRTDDVEAVYPGVLSSILGVAR
jgi:DNA-binding transcriptional ArsR family regulator